MCWYFYTSDSFCTIYMEWRRDLLAEKVLLNILSIYPGKRSYQIPSTDDPGEFTKIVCSISY